MTPDRDLKAALKHGLKGQCPACGGARLFQRFLKPVETCPSCDQDWTPQRADDFPAYLVILILGHLLIPLVIEVNLSFDIAVGVQVVLWPLVVASCALAMIQPVKGAVIGFQWARHMHGFDKN